MFQTSKAADIHQRLRKEILQGGIHKGERLPSTRTLSRLYHASRPTVLVALAKLEQEGLVQRFRGSGVFAQKLKDAQPAERLSIQTVLSKADEVAGQIVRDVSHGRLRVGDVLPLKKELQFQYKCSNLTVRQAVTKVEEQGLIHKKGRAYVVGSEAGSVSAKRRTRVVICGSPAFLRTFAEKRHSREFFQAFEREVRRYGVLEFSFESPAHASASSSSQRLRNMLGYLYLSLHNLSGLNDQGKGLKKSLIALGAQGFPVVFYNYNIVLRRLPNFSFRYARQVYPLGIHGRNGAKEVGVYLLLLGHRHIAYFSYYNDSWCLWRFQGLCLGFGHGTGQGRDVLHFAADRQRYKLATGPNAAAVTRRMWQQLVKNTSKVLGGYAFRKADPGPGLWRETLLAIQQDQCQQNMEPLFRSALRDKSITAWVCADNLVAFSAKEFLTRRNIRIPQDLSLVGIDDDEYAISSAITSYDFEITKSGYLAAHCLIGDLPIRRDRQGLVECPGRIVERGSVARVRVK